MPVGLLLEAARVGEDHARLRGERGQVEVAERRADDDVGAELEPCPVECSARARVDREHDGLLEPADAFDDPPQALRGRVCLAVDREQEVSARLEPQLFERARALARDWREPQRRVGHHVADDLGPAGNALDGELLARALVRREEQLGQSVGLDPVALLRHREVAAAQPGLDVCQRHACVHGRKRPGQGRVGVAVDEHPVGPFLRERLRDRLPHRLGVGGAQIEGVARFLQPQLLEEDLRELGVVVLPGMEHDLVDTALSQRDRSGRRLDELRSVSDHGEDLHARLDYAALRAVSSAGRAGDS